VAQKAPLLSAAARRGPLQRQVAAAAAGKPANRERSFHASTKLALAENDFQLIKRWQVGASRRPGVLRTSLENVIFPLNSGCSTC
jgi:hypothetical protein